MNEQLPGPEATLTEAEADDLALISIDKIAAMFGCTLSEVREAVRLGKMRASNGHLRPQFLWSEVLEDTIVDPEDLPDGFVDDDEPPLTELECATFQLSALRMKVSLDLSDRLKLRKRYQAARRAVTDLKLEIDEAERAVLTLRERTAAQVELVAQLTRQQEPTPSMYPTEEDEADYRRAYSSRPYHD